MRSKSFARRIFLLLLALLILAYFGWDYWREHRFDKEILSAARRYQLDPALVKAVIWRESRFDPGVRGRVGELGLMQIRETAALEWSTSERLLSFHHEDCLNPATNILAGSWYLKKVMARYIQADDPIPYALADYNAGRANVLKWRSGAGMTNSAVFIEHIDFFSTRAYVRSVQRRYERYRSSE